MPRARILIVADWKRKHLGAFFCSGPASETSPKDETMTKLCAIYGCGSASFRRGMCMKHEKRERKHGSPYVAHRRRGLDVFVRPDGYVTRRYAGHVLEHVAIAERVLGRKMPRGAVVHHADGDRANNTKANLVICESRAYHVLLHRRMRAMAESGMAAWRKCQVCKEYAPPDTLRIYASSVHHVECYREKERQRRAKERVGCRST